MDKWLRLLRYVTSIRSGTDIEGTIAEISENARLRGANVWMLICSAILASIGLDLNSTAVIIGAMLISPLMSPILGVGLGIAIYDRRLLRDSLANLGIATLISILTSAVYFRLSPLGELTAELSARTTPTILDVGVAFFGGVAGIVAGSRRNKTSAIPGVAIATALMPPVCTVGFGLAHLESSIFFGAFYLFFINAFFISLATYLICLFLKFPQKADIDAETSARIRRLIVAFALLATLPSAIIFYGVLQKARFDRGLRNFIEKEIRNDRRQPVRWDVRRDVQPPELRVYTVGDAAKPEEILLLNTKLPNYGLAGLNLKLTALNLSPDDLKKASTEAVNEFSERMRIISLVDEQQENEITRLRAELEELKRKTDPDILLLEEIKRRFPQIVDAKWITNATETTPETQKPILQVAFEPDEAESAVFSTVSGIEKLLRERRPDQHFTVSSIRIETPPLSPPTDSNK